MIRLAAGSQTYQSSTAPRGSSTNRAATSPWWVTSSIVPVGSYEPLIRPSPTRVVTSPVPSSRQREMTGVFSLKLSSSRSSSVTAMSPTMPCWGSRTTPVGSPVARSRSSRRPARPTWIRDPLLNEFRQYSRPAASATAIELQALLPGSREIVQRMEPVDVSRATAASSPAAMSSPASVTISWLFDDSNGASKVAITCIVDGSMRRIGPAFDPR